MIFNRPDTTSRVFEVIRQLKPNRLFVAADGPRSNCPQDIQTCAESRAVLEGVDWDCQLHKLFREENRGCGKGPAEAISWFFECVEDGIILEDDCLPNLEFFYFCQDMLEQYRSTPRVMSVAGTNFQNGIRRGRASYYFSSHNRIWGWATWRRVWQAYDYSLGLISEDEAVHILSSTFRHKRERAYWSRVFEIASSGTLDAWDYQFMFLLWKSEGLTVTPNFNLVSNIGGDERATHTNWGEDNPNLYIPTASIYPLIHPEKIVRNRKADEYYFCRFIAPRRRLRYRLKGKLHKLLTSSW